MILHTQVHFHATEETVYQFPVDIVPVNHSLKTIKHGVQAYFSRNGIVRLYFKLFKQCFLVVIMKAIHNLIGQPYKPVDAVDRIMQVLIQAVDTKRKTGAVCFGDISAGSNRYFIKKRFHSSSVLAV